MSGTEDGNLELRIILASGSDPLAGVSALEVRIGDQSATELSVTDGGRIELTNAVTLLPTQEVQVSITGTSFAGELRCRGESAPIRLQTGDTAQVDVVLRPVGQFSAAEAVLDPRVDSTLVPVQGHGVWLLGGQGLQFTRGAVEFISAWTSELGFPVPPMPASRRTPIAFQSDDDTLVVMLGKTDVADAAWITPGESEWSTRTLPDVEPVQFAAFVEDGNGGWVVGGIGSMPPSQVLRVRHQDGQLDVTRSHPLVEPRIRPQAVRVDNRLLITGGGTTLGEWYSTVGKNTVVLEGEPVSGHGLLPLHDGALILGHRERSVERLAWNGSRQQVGELSRDRANITAHWIDPERFIVIGGGLVIDQAELVSWRGGMCESIQTLSLGYLRSGHASVLVQRDPFPPHIFVVGGSDEYGGMHTAVEVFVP